MASHSSKASAYDAVESGLEAFFNKYPSVDTCGRMATLASFLAHEHPHWVFTGFYTVLKDRAMLQIGPYQGKVLATGAWRRCG